MSRRLVIAFVGISLVAVFALGALFSSSAVAQPANIGWEYMVLEINLNEPEVNLATSDAAESQILVDAIVADSADIPLTLLIPSVLDFLGGQGWEMIDFELLEAGRTNYYMKRVVQ